MHFKKSDSYDSERLKRIKGEIAMGAKTPKLSDLSYCIGLIEELRDENLSLWDMLNEIKQSDIENFTEALEKASMLMAAERYLKGMKPEEA
jgi:hypothetical protein